MSRPVRFGTAVVAGAVAVGAARRGLPFVLRRVFAPPQREADGRPGDLGLPEVEVRLTTVGGARLHAWFIPVDGTAPAIIVLHGWSANASLMLPLAPFLHEAGYHALFVDARNHGRSEHDSFTSMPKFAEDLDVAAAWVEGRPEVSAVGVIGHSVGAGAAILSASRSDAFAAVVSVSSMAHPGDTMHRQMHRLPSPARSAILETIQKTIGHRFDDFAPIARLPFVSAPVMLIHGSDDPMVPVDDLHRLAGVHPGAVVVEVPGATHSDLAAFVPAVGKVVAFLDEHLR